MFIATNYLRDVNELKIMIEKVFDMKYAGVFINMKKILSMEIHIVMNARKLWLSQKSYVEKVLLKFDMSNSNDMSTPLTNHFKFSLDWCP